MTERDPHRPLGPGTRIELPELPGTFALYRSLLLARKPGLAPGAPLPALEGVVRGVRTDPDRLAAYRRVCSFPGKALPITYPQILATPLHLALCAAPEFPLRALGLVHMASVLEQERPLAADAPLDLTCRLAGQKDDPSGVRFEIVTEAASGGATAWRSVTSVLARTKKRAAGPRVVKDPPAPGEAASRARSVLWTVPADLGRRYAGVSGDYNPIHLYAATARLFGFPRAIAQGMWSLARCLGEMADALDGKVRVEVEFRRPVLLPARVWFSSGADGAFELRSRDGATLHLSGRLAQG